MRGSEMPIAQPLSKFVTTARTESGCFQHSALGVFGLLRGHKSFGQSSRSLAGPPKRKQKQEHGDYNGAVSQSRPHLRARGDSGEQPGDHRRPRFQSSMRA